MKDSYHEDLDGILTVNIDDGNYRVYPRHGKLYKQSVFRINDDGTVMRRTEYKLTSEIVSRICDLLGVELSSDFWEPVYWDEF